MDNECEQMMKRFAEQNPPKNGNADIEDAIIKAYADMSRRAKGHDLKVNRPPVIEFLKTGKVPDDPDPKNSSLENFIPFVKVINENHQFNKTEFDEWHKECCRRLKLTLTRGNFEGTFGKAQKVINMAFKYWYSWNYNQEEFQEGSG